MPVSGSLGYRSGFLNLPPRVLLRARDNVQDRLSYPKIRRSGGKDFSHEVGFTGGWFDDTMTPVFGTMGGPLTTTVLYPQLLPIYHPLLQSTIATPNVLGSITVDRNLVEDAWEDEYVYGQYGEKEVPVSIYSHGISPFDETRVYLDTTDFYATGTPESTVPGFTSRLADKVQIVIDVNPSELTNVHFSTGSVSTLNDGASAMVGGTPNSHYAYYNFYLKRWEAHCLNGNFSDYNNFDFLSNEETVRSKSCRAFAVGPSGGSQKSFVAWEAKGYDEADWNAFCLGAGSATSNSGFPHAVQYDATGSQSLSMAAYIDRPFLLEKLTLEFNASFGPTYLDPADSGTEIKSFFLLNQFMNTFGADDAGVDGPSQRYDINTTSWSAWPTTSEISSSINHTFTSGFQKDLIAVGQVALAGAGQFLHGESLSGSLQRDLTARMEYRQGYASDTVAVGDHPMLGRQPATTYLLEFYPRIPNMDTEGSTAWGQYAYQDRSNPGGSTDAATEFNKMPFGGRGMTGRPTGRNIVDTIPGFEPSGSVPTEIIAMSFPTSLPSKGAAGELLRAPKSRYTVSPYLLMPTDYLTLGFENIPRWGTFQGMPIQHGSSGYRYGEEALYLNRTILNPGVGKLTLFGSYLRDDVPVTDAFNQPLTSDALHETTHEIISDQFQVEPEAVYNGSYIDDIYAGSLFSRTSRYVAGRPTEGTQGTTGSLLRAIKMATEDERYFDSVMPDTKTYFIDSTAAVSGAFFKPTAYKRLPATAIFLSGALDFSSAYSGSIFIKEPLAFPYASDPPRVVSDITPVVLHTSGNLGIGGGVGEQDNTLYTVSGQTAFDILYRTRYSNMSASLRYITRGAGQNDQGLPVVSVNDSRTGQGGQATGFRYGIVNSRPLYSEAVFRYDKFGQMRDMLEQRHDTRFFDGSVKGSTQVLEPPIEIVFVDGNGNIVRPIRTTSQNLSKFATSSIPYIDGEFTDRPAPLKQRINIIEIDEIVG